MRKLMLRIIRQEKKDSLLELKRCIISIVALKLVSGKSSCEEWDMKHLAETNFTNHDHGKYFFDKEITKGFHLLTYVETQA